MAAAIEQEKKRKRSHYKTLFEEYKQFLNNNNKQCKIFKFEVRFVYFKTTVQNVSQDYLSTLNNVNAMK